MSTDSTDDGEIQPILEETRGVEERDGLLVITAVPAADIVDAIDALRESRMDAIWGYSEP